MEVVIELKETSQKISYGMAENAYTKGPFYCVLIPVPTEEPTNFVVHKFPVANIWRVSEDYGPRSLDASK